MRQQAKSPSTYTLSVVYLSKMILPQAVLALVVLQAVFCEENNGEQSYEFLKKETTKLLKLPGASLESAEQPFVNKQKQGIAIPGFGNLGGVPGAAVLPGQQPLVPGVGQPVIPSLTGTGVGAPVVPGVPGVPPQPVVPGLPGLGGTNGVLPGFGGLPGAGQPGVGVVPGGGVSGVNSGILPAAGTGGLGGVLGVPVAAGRK